MVVAQRGGAFYQGSSVKRWGRFVFRWLSEFATGRSIADINSGLRVFRRSEIVPFFPSISTGFSFTTTTTLVYMLNGLFVTYLPIAYHQRVGVSKVRYVRDTLRALQIIVECILRYNPLKLFLLIACPFLGMAALLLLIAIVLQSLVLFLIATVALSTGVLILAQGFVAASLVEPRPMTYRRQLEYVEMPDHDVINRDAPLHAHPS